MQNKIDIVREIKIHQEVTVINDISAITELGPEKNEIRMITSMEKTEGQEPEMPRRQIHTQ